MPGDAKKESKRSLRALITCPHCWTQFKPGDINWVARHPQLRGDPLLGTDALQRFLPTRFTVEGLALDVKEEVCTTLACPNCHLVIPRILLETGCVFLSTIGTPSSGKSYFLAAMTDQARVSLNKKLGVSFVDSDGEVNRILNEYELALFSNRKSDQLVRIQKTRKGGDQYNVVRRGDRAIFYPQPFVFSISPRGDAGTSDGGQGLSQAVCLYDNAGEHFLPGAEGDSTATNHLSKSRALLFLFDPMQHGEFRAECDQLSSDPTFAGLRVYRQDLVLVEAGERLRLGSQEKYSRPLIIVVTKYDAWRGMLGNKQLARDWALARDGSSKAALDLAAIQEVSNSTRKLLSKYASAVVVAAEKLSREVVYIPVSALGRSPIMAKDNLVYIRAKEIDPIGVDVPLLYALHRTMGKLVPAVKQRGKQPIWVDAHGVPSDASRSTRRSQPAPPPGTSKPPEPPDPEGAGPPAKPKPPPPTPPQTSKPSESGKVVPVRAVPETEPEADTPRTIPLKETG